MFQIQNDEVIIKLKDFILIVIFAIILLGGVILWTQAVGKDVSEVRMKIGVEKNYDSILGRIKRLEIRNEKMEIKVYGKKQP